MNVLENFQNLFVEIWQQGIAGINFTQIGLGIVILLLFVHQLIIMLKLMSLIQALSSHVLKMQLILISTVL